MVVATHMLGEVVLTADRIAILDGGRLRVAGTLKDAIPTDAEGREWLESTLMECG